jgi:tetraacyldisaccharide 4'-kinase
MIPLSNIFGKITAARNGLYDRGFFKIERLAAPVISVGNISVGGAGKTPFVIVFGHELQRRGIAFDILSRGYRRTKQGTLRLPDHADPSLYGDEPALLQKELEVPVFVANRRVMAGRMAESDPQPRVHVLDDGFQHRQLHRDFNIVVLSPSNLDDQLLPVGRLREPITSLKRADAVVVPEGFSRAIPDFAGAVWQVRRRLVFDGEVKGAALAFCGLALPEQFLELLRVSGVDAREVLAFPDHHSYRERDFAKILAKARTIGAELLITTSKDAIKLERLQLSAEFQRGLRVARLITELVDPDAVLNHLLSTLQQRCPAWFNR